MMKNAPRSTAGGRNAEMMLGRRISTRGSGQQRYRVQAFNPILGGNLLSMADVSTEIGDAAPSEVLDAGLDIGTGVPDPSPVVDMQSQFASVGITEALSNMNLEDMLSDVVDLVPFEPLQGFVSMVGHDVIGLVTLHPSVLGVLRIVGLYYFIFARPSPLAAILDFYIFGPVSKLLGGRFSENDFTLRDRLGNGNYGQGRNDVFLDRLITKYMI